MPKKYGGFRSLAEMIAQLDVDYREIMSLCFRIPISQANNRVLIDYANFGIAIAFGEAFIYFSAIIQRFLDLPFDDVLTEQIRLIIQTRCNYD